MNGAHTPGPWSWIIMHGEFTVESRLESIAKVCSLREGDARLIAAAPDMLEALENIENDDDHMPRTAWDMIQNAIRKAKEGK